MYMSTWRPRAAAAANVGAPATRERGGGGGGGGANAAGAGRVEGRGMSTDAGRMRGLKSLSAVDRRRAAGKSSSDGDEPVADADGDEAQGERGSYIEESGLNGGKSMVFGGGMTDNGGESVVE